MSKKIRVPATTVQLVQILGVILREHLKIPIDEEGSECWTFEHVVDWDIQIREPGPKASHAEWCSYQYRVELGRPEHEMSVYLGAGYCHVFNPEQGVKRLELRVRCEHSIWVTASLRMWDFQIWGKFDGEPVWRNHFSCSLGYGTDRDILPETLAAVPQSPPKKIAFWRKAGIEPVTV